MCTSISKNADGLIFGRNMDIDCSFGERFVLTPRRFPLTYKCLEESKVHYGFFGTAAVVDNYPLYAEGANEYGLCVAALNFAYNAHYSDYREDMVNLAPYELIPKLLSECKSTKEARAMIESVNLVNIPFKEDLPLSYLHFHIADKYESLVFEVTKNGNRIYDNPIGVLANNPPFDAQLNNLSAYNYIKNQTREPTFFSVEPYSLGISATGLPGDYSSFSRFVKASFLSHYSNWENKIPQMLAILGAVSVPRGAVIEKCREHYTLYSCVIDAEELTYYYKTHNSIITSVFNVSSLDMNGTSLEIHHFI